MIIFEIIGIDFIENRVRFEFCWVLLIILVKEIK